METGWLIRCVCQWVDVAAVKSCATSGSNWVPDPFRTIWSASSGVMASRPSPARLPENRDVPGTPVEQGQTGNYRTARPQLPIFFPRPPRSPGSMDRVSMSAGGGTVDALSG